MCAQDKGKAFPLNTQKVEPGQKRGAACASHRRQFLIFFLKDISDWLAIACVTEAEKRPKSTCSSPISQQNTTFSLFLWYASFSNCFFFFFDHFPQVLTYCRSSVHTIQDRLYVNFSTPQLLTCRVPRPGLQDLSPSLLLSVNQAQAYSVPSRNHNVVLAVTDDELKSSVLYCGKRSEVLWKLCTRRAPRGPI